MKKLFTQFWERMGLRGTAGAVFGFLSDAYSESNRYYHNLEHIRCCLAEFAAVQEFAEQPECVEAAIWFHDVVYDPGRKDNEEQSAETAYQMLRQANVPEEMCQTVHGLILATKHNKLPVSWDEQIITDVDLAILGKPAEIYNEYEKNIRREYAFVSDEDYRKGRTAVLRSFLERSFIYSTEYFRSEYQRAAQENLRRAICELSNT